MDAFEKWWDKLLDIHFTNMIELKCLTDKPENRQFSDECMNKHKQFYRYGWEAALRWAKKEVEEQCDPYAIDKELKC